MLWDYLRYHAVLVRRSFQYTKTIMFLEWRKYTPYKIFLSIIILLGLYLLGESITKEINKTALFIISSAAIFPCLFLLNYFVCGTVLYLEQSKKIEELLEKFQIKENATATYNMLLASFDENKRIMASIDYFLPYSTHDPESFEKEDKLIAEANNWTNQLLQKMQEMHLPLQFLSKVKNVTVTNENSIKGSREALYHRNYILNNIIEHYANLVDGQY